MNYVLAFLLLLLADSAGAAEFERFPPQETIQVVRNDADQGGVDRDRAAQIAGQATGGRILGVDTGDKDGEAVHRVKVLLQNGSVRVVFVAVKSGRIVE